ncbi:uncharacterized protein METZ01_LOCUS260259 [marine metagenome]|uniref:Uncharacterized protein n=1 Tax=marine metagenome TaxID=408172 RepID=A0A382J785_9ZZZZ
MGHPPLVNVQSVNVKIAIANIVNVVVKRNN